MGLTSRNEFGGKAQGGASILTAVVKGFVISICAAVLASIILAVILASTTWLKLGTSGLLLINYLSIAIGGLYGAKVSQGKGWLVGLAVGALYGILAIGFGSVGASSEVGMAAYQRGALGMAAAIAVGTISGMIGINLK